MDDTLHGTRDKRGDWRPNEPLRVGPLLDFPWNPLQILKWLPSYFLPWNVLFMALGAVLWFWLTPARETETLAPGWVLYILLRNSAIILLIYGALELWLYVRRSASKNRPALRPLLVRRARTSTKPRRLTAGLWGRDDGRSDTLGPGFPAQILTRAKIERDAAMLAAERAAPGSARCWTSRGILSRS